MTTRVSMARRAWRRVTDGLRLHRRVDNHDIMLAVVVSRLESIEKRLDDIEYRLRPKGD